MSQNLFDFCQLTVSRGINWNKTALEEITNSLEFKVISYDPLIITREGLSVEIFLKLIETLQKCLTSGPQSEDFEFISSQFANLNIKDNSEQIKKNVPVVSELPSIATDDKTAQIQLVRNINTTPFKEIKNVYFGENKTDSVTKRHENCPCSDENCQKNNINAYDFEHVPLSVTKFNFPQPESSSDINAQVISLNDDFCGSPQSLDHRGEDSEDIENIASKGSLNYCEETKKPGQTDSRSSSLNYKVLTEDEKIIISKFFDDDNVAKLNCQTKKTEITTEIQNKGENEINTNNDKVVPGVSLEQKTESGEASPRCIVVKESDSKKQNCSSKSISQDIIETTEKCSVVFASRKKEKEVKSPNDDFKVKHHFFKDMVTTDHTKASEESTREVKQGSFEQFNQDGDHYKTDEFKSSLNNIQSKMHIEGAGSELDENVQFLFNENDFEAVKYYFQDHNQSFQKCLHEAKLLNNKYVIEFNEREVSKEDYETLKSFKTSCFDRVEESQASEWQKSIKIKQPKIKTLFKSAEKLFYIMGPKGKMRAATSMIITFRGNNDDELMWQKVPEETKDTSSNSMRSHKQTSSDAAKLVYEQIYDQRDKHSDSNRSSKKSLNENKQVKMITTKSSKFTEDERQVSSFNINGLKLEKFQEKNLRKIEKSSKGLIYLGNNLRVNVCNDDITKLDVDIIVNAANIHLAHKGGVAAAIAKAAGSQLQEECEDFIQKHKALEVTEIFVSSGGNLKARKVIHAVGPRWDYYKDKNKCSEDLRHTVLRCLVEASRLNVQNIALPSISAAIFGVPPDLCAQSYMAAVKHFDCIREELNLTSLQEIMFVDVNDDLVNTIQEEFVNRWENDLDENLLKNDLNFAKQQLNNPTPAANTSLQNAGAKPKEPRQSISSSGTMGAKATEKGQKYTYESLNIIVSVKPALISANEVVIVLGEPFKNISGAEDFEVKKHLQEDRSESVLNNKKITVFRSVYNSNSRGVRYVCCLPCDTSSKEKMEKALQYLATLDLSSLSDQKLFTLVITSKILFNGKKQSNFKLVNTLADLLHKYIPKASKNTILKGIRIATSEDALPNIIKVFNSRKDLKAVEKAAERNWKTNEPNPRESNSGRQANEPNPRESNSGRQTDDQRSFTTGNSAPIQTSEYFNSATNYPTSYYENLHAQGGSSVDMETLCMKCQRKISFHLLPCCGREMCTDCYKKCAICPFCGSLFRILTGNQPEGEMSVKYTIYPYVSTYPQLGAWQITYHFQNGIQKEDHPHPGKPYTGSTRTAFLPDTNEGYRLLQRLKIAFMRRLTFTISSQNRIIWNDIHHKTNLYGGRSNFGYPDPTYLMTLDQELKERGVVFQSLSQTEEPELQIFDQAVQFERSRPLFLKASVHF